MTPPRVVLVLVCCVSVVLAAACAPAPSHPVAVPVQSPVEWDASSAFPYVFEASHGRVDITSIVDGGAMVVLAPESPSAFWCDDVTWTRSTGENVFAWPTCPAGGEVDPLNFGCVPSVDPCWVEWDSPVPITASIMAGLPTDPLYSASGTLVNFDAPPATTTTTSTTASTTTTTEATTTTVGESGELSGSAEACAWEWGGVTEAAPTPCADPQTSRFEGAAVTYVGLGAVLGLTGLGVLTASAVRSKRV